MPDPAESPRRARAATLEPWFVLPAEERKAGVRVDVLEVTPCAESWASSFDPEETRFVATGGDRFARSSDQRSAMPSLDLALPYDDESFDLVYGVDALRDCPVSEKRNLLFEMWRVTRAGGRLLFLEDFVPAEGSEGPHPTSMNDFEASILVATAGRVALEHVESICYPGEDMRRAGLVSMMRLGRKGLGPVGPDGNVGLGEPEGGWPRLEWDEPADGTELIAGAVVRGWAYSPAGIREVTVWLNGRRTGRAEHGLERPDAAVVQPGALRGGFSLRLETVDALSHPATAELTVIAEDMLGRHTKIRRTVRTPAEERPPRSTGSSKKSRRVAGAPSNA